MLSFSYLHVISFGLEHKIYKFNSLSNILSSYVIVNLKVASITRPFVLCIHLNFSWKLAILNISMWWLGNKHFLFYLLFYAAWWFLNCFFFVFCTVCPVCIELSLTLLNYTTHQSFLCFLKATNKPRSWFCSLILCSGLHNFNSQSVSQLCVMSLLIVQSPQSM